MSSLTQAWCTVPNSSDYKLSHDKLDISDDSVGQGASTKQSAQAEVADPMLLMNSCAISVAIRYTKLAKSQMSGIHVLKPATASWEFQYFL